MFLKETTLFHYLAEEGYFVRQRRYRDRTIQGWKDGEEATENIMEF